MYLKPGLKSYLAAGQEALGLSSSSWKLYLCLKLNLSEEKTSIESV